MAQCSLCDEPVDPTEGESHLVCQSRKARGLPVSLEDFTGYCCSAVSQTRHEQYGALLMTVDEQPGIMVMPVPMGETPGDVTEFYNGRRFAGMATLVSWSPNDVADYAPAWALTTVQRDHAARFSMFRWAKPDGWWRLDAADAPWFLLSTAGAIRGMLDGESAPMRTVEDDRLLGTVFDPPPPTHADGRI